MNFLGTVAIKASPPMKTATLLSLVWWKLISARWSWSRQGLFNNFTKIVTIWNCLLEVGYKKSCSKILSCKVEQCWLWNPRWSLCSLQDVKIEEVLCVLRLKIDGCKSAMLCLICVLSFPLYKLLKSLIWNFFAFVGRAQPKLHVVELKVWPIGLLQFCCIYGSAHVQLVLTHQSFPCQLPIESRCYFSH